MTKTAFRNDFSRGLGSALITLQSCADPTQFHDVILHGCLHNTTYDMQCEGDRGWYLHQAAKLSGNAASIVEAVCQKFSCVRKDRWLFDQLSSILYHFAVDGSECARNALYQQYDDMLHELSRKRKFEQIYHRRDMFEHLCIWLTSLDGWGAFKQIVADVSHLLLSKNADFFFLDWFYCNAKSKFGEKRIAQYLQKQSDQSLHIRIYFETAKKWDNHFPIQKERPIPTLDEILALANQGRGRGSAMHFVRNADAKDLEKLAQAAMNALDADIQVELLWGFRRKSMYSFPEEFLLRLSQSADERLRCLAYDMIGQNPTPKTRKLARSLIQSGKDLENGINLLVKNLLPTDEPLLYDAVKSFRPRRNSGNWHGIYMDANDGIKAMRGKPKTNILEYLYHNTLCGFCRESIVRTMHKKGVLSDKILHECHFDANLDIQKFAEQIGRYRNYTE